MIWKSQVANAVSVGLRREVGQDFALELWRSRGGGADCLSKFKMRLPSLAS